MYTLSTINLGKKINNKIIFEDININMYSEHIYGFMGQNGSGKTMLLRILAGLVRPSTGHILLNGNEYIPFQNRELSTGIVIENINLYANMTAYENLKLLAKINNKIKDSEVRQAIHSVGLDPYDKTKIGKYSLGMRQKVILAQAIMEKPSLLLLDEPANSLDNISKTNFYNQLLDLSKENCIIAITCHNQEDILDICDTVYAFQNGTLKKI